MAREYKASLNPALPPVHPGTLLREEVLPAAKLSVTDAAAALGITRQTLHNIPREAQGVTPSCVSIRNIPWCGTAWAVFTLRPDCS